MKKERNPVNTKAAERAYAVSLRQVARQVGSIIGAFPPGDPSTVPTIERLLREYADLLRPWAERTASKMLEAVNTSDLRAWKRNSKDLAAGIARTITETPVGDTMLGLLAEQVDLIRSLPLEAAQRVHTLTVKALENSTRASEIKEEIMRSGHVTESRATLIARTEVARTASTLTQARAISVGSQGYVWETSRDGDVRPSHKKMQGKIVEWDKPPTLDKMSGHAGEFPNCRCWPRVILPKMDKK